MPSGSRELPINHLDAGAAVRTPNRAHVHVCTVSELVRSLVERRGLSEREATEIVARALREDPRALPRRQRVPTEARIRIERLAGTRSV
jgi:hypothetical protein